LYIGLRPRLNNQHFYAHIYIQPFIHERIPPNEKLYSDTENKLVGKESSLSSILLPHTEHRKKKFKAIFFVRQTELYTYILCLPRQNSFSKLFKFVVPIENCFIDFSQT
jgi:hypothetical protein